MSLKNFRCGFFTLFFVSIHIPGYMPCLGGIIWCLFLQFLSATHVTQLFFSCIFPSNVKKTTKIYLNVHSIKLA